MQMARQIFLAGAAMSLVARELHETFKSLSDEDQDVTLNWCKQKSGTVFDRSELLDQESSFKAIDRALQSGFTTWRKQAREEGCPLMKGEELSIVAQWTILEHLPFVPSEHGNPEFIGALEHCAPYYLSYAA